MLHKPDKLISYRHDALRKLVTASAEKNKVDVQFDFLTSVGRKITLTMAAEAWARTGHDICTFVM